MRLTRRGRNLLLALILSAAFAVGYLTADWSWYGGWR